MHQHRRPHGFHMTTIPPSRPEIILQESTPYPVSSSEPTLVKRVPAPAGDGSSSETCSSGSGSCEKYQSSTKTATLPVVLGAVVPVVCAIVVLFFLHRRHVKKLRNEDANDKHKSLDFGLDIVEPTGGAKAMREPEKAYHNHTKGISLDIGHPYLLPPGMHDSRDSLHSLSRSVGDDGKYRPATSLMPNDAMSTRSYPRGPHDDASSFTGSTSRLALGDDMNQGLLRNAQRMSRSSPPLYESPSIDTNAQPQVDHDQGHGGFRLELPRSISPGLAISPLGDEQTLGESKDADTGPVDLGRRVSHIGSTVDHGILAQNIASQNEDARPTSDIPNDNSNMSSNSQDYRASYLGSANTQTQPDTTQTSTANPPRISLPLSDRTSDYADNRKSAFMIPDVNVHGTESVQDADNRKPAFMIPDVNVHGTEDMQDHKSTEDSVKLPEEPSRNQNLGLDPRRDTRRLTLGLRPLPPEDPSDNPEQRANRIRSFYKEYFDESKTGRETMYYEDYGPEFYDSVMYEDYYPPIPRPFAEPINRRAMTPPPRAPPYFQGGARHMPTGSAGGFSGPYSPGPRAFSSASGRLPGARGPRKPVAPPAPLQELPTPHMLKNDDAIMQATDFAPGKNFRDQREGRAETPLGGLRPFSPMAPAHSPLLSSFDELSTMPSPHALRKSGTFNNLDFAPPPRFKNQETASDSGSIRSNRTGISYTHLHNIRTGAYRVSRLPTDTVGTKDDMMASLQPSWDMRK